MPLRLSDERKAETSIYIDVAAETADLYANTRRIRARRAMDALVSRARRIGPLRSLSDPLLLALFANSDCIPDRVQQGVVRMLRHLWAEVVDYI
ncbi:hypothetical protein NECAME_09244 [Necator americanus]|uniref:Uncharacterized protein n=1 Tax=Necator americanus TaxID=51031 RepID=W2TE78_NECAM|nr:hypothetical protein NECAME_09244 [Necator americanus]ETN80350.1 hypothetical protein NECAME_09244 [Necator americanus]